MKVCVELPVESRGIARVRDNLIKYKPDSVEIVKNATEADLTILHVIGRHDRVERQVNNLRASGKQYAMIQYCIRSTMSPSTADWINMWKGARLVWSYYYLPELVWQDHVSESFPFYYAPLGVDADVFKESPFYKQFVVGATSQHALSEGARECAIASQHTNKEMFFLGHELRRSNVHCASGLSDDKVASYWSKCKYISGLRRIEGFELPVIEGLMCGARPIVYDQPHYRAWFDKFAVFIKEGSREEVIEQLEVLFARDPNPVTEEEKVLAKSMFNWQTIITNFWKQLI